MLKLVDGIVELYKKVATSLPPDMEHALRTARDTEPADSRAQESLRIMLENVTAARKTGTPLCQDTGIPIFFVQVPSGISQIEVKDAIIEATRIATAKIPLRPNAVDTISGENSGDNTGAGFPVMYLEETEKETLTIDLILKGSGCENIGQTYKLPHERLNAQRDFAGVKKCILDAVFQAQGKACPPYTIGVGIGASKDQVAVLAKRQMLRKLTDRNPIPPLASLEQSTLEEVNTLSIGTLGLGGTVTAVGIKVGVNHRHPASYFVEVTFSCWANRRGTLLW